MKVPLVVMPQYVIYGEWDDDRIWIHADVYTWTPRVCRDFRRHLDAAIRALARPVYVYNVPAGGVKRRKFIELMGFKHLCTLDNGLGEVFRRD